MTHAERTRSLADSAARIWQEQDESVTATFHHVHVFSNVASATWQPNEKRLNIDRARDAALLSTRTSQAIITPASTSSMGLFLTRMYDAFASMAADKPTRILMLGLDAAGKTTILYKVKLDEHVSTIPTIGRQRNRTMLFLMPWISRVQCRNSEPVSRCHLHRMGCMSRAPMRDIVTSSLSVSLAGRWSRENSRPMASLLPGN